MGADKIRFKIEDGQFTMESLPPAVQFDDHEVFAIFWSAFGENIPEELTKAYQNALRAKGINIPDEPTPDPPGVYR